MFCYNYLICRVVLGFCWGFISFLCCFSLFWVGAVRFYNFACSMHARCRPVWMFFTRFCWLYLSCKCIGRLDCVCRAVFVIFFGKNNVFRFFDNMMLFLATHLHLPCHFLSAHLYKHSFTPIHLSEQLTVPIISCYVIDFDTYPSHLSNHTPIHHLENHVISLFIWWNRSEIVT